MLHQLNQDVLRISKPEWICGDGFMSLNRHGSYFSAGSSMRNDLPIEFFNHELISLNTEDSYEVACFVEEWGMPFHPTRFGSMPYESLGSDVKDQIDAAVNETDILAELLIDPMLEAKECAKECIIISEVETLLSLLHMQRAVLAIREIIVDGFSENEGYIELVNASATSAGVISIADKYQDHTKYIDDGCNMLSETTLTNAISNQILGTVSNSAPWQICAYCGKPFKFQRDYSPRKAKTVRKQSQTKYCCNRCSQNMKDVKRGKRNPPDWWEGEYSLTDPAR